MDILDAAEAAGKAIREISEQGYQRGISEGRKRGLREAVEGIKRAWYIAGPNPRYHKEQVERLKKEWPTLYEAIEAAIEKEGK